MKKQAVAAVVLLLLIPVVVVLGGMLFSLINPEIAAGHPNYLRNYHLLNLGKMSVLWGSLALAGVLWMLSCLLMIRSKKRSYRWMVLTVFGPFGFAVLALLHDREPAEADRYSRFVRGLNWYMRAAYEICFFVAVWIVAYEAMVLKRNLMIAYQAATTGVSTAQIISVQNGSSGMWAFSEMNEVMFFVAVLYLLRPFVFSVLGSVAARMRTAKAG